MKLMLRAGAAGLFALVATPLFPLSGSGDSAAGSLDTVAPTPGSATVPPTGLITGTSIPYAGASDATGLARVELWAREDSAAWAFSTLVVTNGNASGSFTFTFGEGVTGFGASDVTVTGGTKGTFTPVSPTVHTLGVTGKGGTVNASVAAGAATAASGSGNGKAAATPYSNFYLDTWTITLPGSVPMELIRIPAGTFTMGSPAGELSRNGDETQHTVTLSQDFYLGKTEVTQQQWLAIYGSFPQAQAHGTNDNLPVHRVSHNDIANASTGFLELLNDHVTEPARSACPQKPSGNTPAARGRRPGSTSATASARTRAAQRAVVARLTCGTAGTTLLPEPRWLVKSRQTPGAYETCTVTSWSSVRTGTAPIREP